MSLKYVESLGNGDDVWCQESWRSARTVDGFCFLCGGIDHPSLKHWHVHHGDVSDMFPTAREVSDHLISYTLADLGQWLVDLRDSEKKMGDDSFVTMGVDPVKVMACLLNYRHAVHAQQCMDDIEILCMNLDNKRASAPLYRDRPEAWDATLTGLLLDEFPFRAYGSYEGICVVQCSGEECWEEADGE